jgi:hypothetical protein
MRGENGGRTGVGRRVCSLVLETATRPITVGVETRATSSTIADYDYDYDYDYEYEYEYEEEQDFTDSRLSELQQPYSYSHVVLD